jgi:hypothetical protein
MPPRETARAPDLATRRHQHPSPTDRPDHDEGKAEVIVSHEGGPTVVELVEWDTDVRGVVLGLAVSVGGRMVLVPAGARAATVFRALLDAAEREAS